MSKLFISCVSAEFADYRDQLVRDLRRPNVEVKSHEEVRDFNSGLTTLEKLDDYIRNCDAVIHLSGGGTGSEVEPAQVAAIERRYSDLSTILPPVAPLLAADAPWRGSYTQWEAYLALYHLNSGRLRRCFIYRAKDHTPRASGFSADTISGSRQAEHFLRLEALGRDRNDFDSRESLRVQALNHLLDVLWTRSEPLKAEPSNLWKLQTKPDSVFEGREQVLAALDARWADALTDTPGRAQIVSLIAIGGAGKTTVVSRWKDALLARDLHGGVERYLDWSFYHQGTPRDGEHNAAAHSAPDATVFVAAALKFFGDEAMASSAAPAWDKGARLATLVSQFRSLLILDGLEPLQHPPGPQAGELRDDAIRALFAGLQQTGRGLCVVTTREPIADLAATQGTRSSEWALDRLTDAAGAAVLRGHGVEGPLVELETASREVKGHALTLALMGRYLRLAFHPPDISRRDCFHFSEADALTKDGHAFRVFAAYEQWLEREGRHVEVAVLRLVGLFDRPAAPGGLAALCAPPAIGGLTDPLVDLPDTAWNIAVQHLIELNLVEPVQSVTSPVSGYDESEANVVWRAEYAKSLGAPRLFVSDRQSSDQRPSLDAHPLLRDYFAVQGRQRGTAPQAHGRLFEYLCATVPYWPEGRDGLLPLYQAVAHGCKAGRFEEARAVFHDRILRGTTGAYANYSTFSLGLIGLDLAAQACFFLKPWVQVTPNLLPRHQAWLFNEVAFSLRALNRLPEARAPLRAALNMRVQQEQWHNASRVATTLSDLELTLGDVPAAVSTGAQAVAFAQRSHGADERHEGCATHAYALLQAGRRDESGRLFAEAERILAASQRGQPELQSVSGYQYCEFLLSTADRVAWRSLQRLDSSPEKVRDAKTSLVAIEPRVTRTLSHTWNTIPMDRGLAHLMLGRVYWLRGLLEFGDGTGERFAASQQHLDQALADLREAAQSQFLPPALLSRACLHAVAGELDLGRQRLDEAFAVATRSGLPENGWLGGMRLHLIDTLLHRARLFGRLTRGSRTSLFKSEPPAGYPWIGRSAAADLGEAAQLIAICGYGRRDRELTDAQAALA
jgi:hypothetical protein